MPDNRSVIAAIPGLQMSRMHMVILDQHCFPKSEDAMPKKMQCSPRAFDLPHCQYLSHRIVGDTGRHQLKLKIANSLGHLEEVIWIKRNLSGTQTCNLCCFTAQTNQLDLPASWRSTQIISKSFKAMPHVPRKKCIYCQEFPPTLFSDISCNC